MAKQAETARVSESIQTELHGDSAEIAKRLFGEVQGGAHKMTKPEYLDYVRRNWGSVQFRQQLLQQVGPKNFLETWRQTFPGAEEALKATMKMPMNVSMGSGQDTTPPELATAPPGGPG